MVTSTAAVVVEQVDPEADAEESSRGERLILNHVSLFEWQTLRLTQLNAAQQIRRSAPPRPGAVQRFAQISSNAVRKSGGIGLG